MRALDWIGRLLLLVLSGFATLSLIGAIAQVADTAADRPSLSSPPAEIAERPAIEPLPPQPAETPMAVDSHDEHLIAAPAAAPVHDDAIARWLEALVYAVMALAGFAAAGVILLLRLTATLSRIAGR